jgi:uncharacterized lipoprotein YmbA
MMHRLLLRIALGVSLMVLGGCAGTQPTRFYVLTSLSRSDAKRAVAVGQGVAIGIRPVALPRYLDRPQIVTRASRNQLDIADFDQWAEPLKDSIANVIAENLSILIPTDSIAVFPWNRSTPVLYQLAVEVTRFEGNAGGDSLLIARWSVIGEKGRKVVVSRKSSFREPVGAKDYKAVVSAMNKTLDDLSREIAEAIKGLPM